MAAVRDGAFYGFPFSYHGQHVDDRVKSQDPNMVVRRPGERFTPLRARVDAALRPDRLPHR
jgi:glucose/arabinose dehydrogenase